MWENRKELRKIIENKEKQISEIRAEIDDLRKEDMLFSDDEQWYTEEVRKVYYYEKDKRKKPTEGEKTIGYVNWHEKFKDEDTGEVIVIKRCQIVTIDGSFDAEYDFSFCKH